uniref:L antigen family member 3-like isoform X1 n=1 Tax=Doryrhamphus excisus TaxID=161450 RepID=UPI0025ADEEF2|nr:L antigen family member 3-like isoform X1 [Doryrhamphus excisus]
MCSILVPGELRVDRKSRREFRILPNVAHWYFIKFVMSVWAPKFPSPAFSSLDVPFPSSRDATIALRSLSPDREPRKGGISKQLMVSGSTLSVRWSADEARILRVSVKSFLDHLTLVMETMQMFPADT